MLNKLINFLQWPIALIMAWSFPAALMLLWKYLTEQHYSFQNIPPIVIGLAGYLLLWYLIFKRREVGSYFSTLEHECTHALFAILTGHSLKGFRVTAHHGGQVVFKGGSGNWLITIAPYFFPTITILLLSIRLFVPQNYWLELGIGASIGFHLTSTVLETHGAQTDLKEAGKIFSFCFLPSANVLTYTFIGAYLQSGLHGVKLGLIFLSSTVTTYSISAFHFLHSFVKQ